MGSVIGAGDTLARIGGDEFAVIVEDASGEAAHRLGRKLCARMDDFRFAHEGQRFRIGASIGLVPIRLPLDGRGGDHAGRPTPPATRPRTPGATACTPGSTPTRACASATARRGGPPASSRRSTRTGSRCTRSASVPRTENRTGCTPRSSCGLRDEEGRTIPPGAFLPAAERFHLVTRIDRWVLQRVIGIVGGACRSLHRADHLHQPLGAVGRGPASSAATRSRALERAGGEVCRPALPRDHRDRRHHQRRRRRRLHAAGCAHSASASRSTTSAPGRPPRSATSGTSRRTC